MARSPVTVSFVGLRRTIFIVSRRMVAESVTSILSHTYYHMLPQPTTITGKTIVLVMEGKGNFGYDAKSEKFVDLLKEGIIDPKKVTRIALENAASVAGMILTTECALVDIKEDTPPMPPMGGGGGMPGMM